MRIALVLSLLFALAFVIRFALDADDPGASVGTEEVTPATTSGTTSPFATPLKIPPENSINSSQKVVPTESVGDAAELPPVDAFPDEIILTFETTIALELFLDSLKDEEVSVIHRIPELQAVRLHSTSLSALEKLKQRASQSGGSPSFNFPISTPQQPREELLAGNTPFGKDLFRLLGVPKDNRSYGKGITIAVLDSAVERHESFRGRQLSIHSVFENPSQSQSFHGTSVSSAIIASNEFIRGIAPEAKVVAIEVLDSEGRGDAFTVASGIFEALALDADIINLSLGTGSDAPVLRDAVKAATEAGVILVAAAGNESSSQVPFPARYREVLAVTSIDATNRPAPFVNTNDAIDLAAPGIGIFSAVGTDAYATISGTSISAPITSAAIAAILSEFPQKTPDEAVQLILESTNDFGLPFHDSTFGEGAINFGRALRSREKNIRDVALSDHVLDRTRITDEEIPLLITVENRGTVALRNIKVRYKVDGKQITTTIPKLIQPGEVSAIEVPLAVRSLESEKGVELTSAAAILGDVDQSNNSKTSRITINPN